MTALRLLDSSRFEESRLRRAQLQSFRESFHIGVGATPTSWCTVRFVPVGEDVWAGLAPRGSLFVEHARMEPRCVAMGSVLGRAVCVEGTAVVLDDARAAFGVSAEEIQHVRTQQEARLSAVATVAVVFRVDRVRDDLTAEELRGAVPRT